MREEINQKYNALILRLNKNKSTCQARKEYFENKMEGDLDVIDSLEQSQKMNRQKRKFYGRDSKIQETVNSKRRKMILEFNNQEAT